MVHRPQTVVLERLRRGRPLTPSENAVSLTAGEKRHLAGIWSKMERLRDYLATREAGTLADDASDWYERLVGAKRILGNFDNDVSFVATLMAKQFLSQRHPSLMFDVSLKAQSAPGLDIDEVTPEGERVIAEIKTTIPYGETEFGAQQKSMFYKDFEKLAAADAPYRYFIVTEEKAFEVVKRRYLSRLEGVTVALLPLALADARYVVPAAGPERVAAEVIAPSPGTRPSDPPSPLSGEKQADQIRRKILELIEPARNTGEAQLTLRSADVLKAVGLPGNYYPNICSAMRGKKLQKLTNVRIVERKGRDGANFYVSYEL